MKNKIVVTDLGNKVLNYLDDKFHDIIHKDFTSGVESDLDKISNGELIWTDVVNKIYNTFMPIVIKEIGNKIQSGKKATARNRERTILEIVRRLHIETGEIVSLNDVLTEAGRGDISRDVAEDLIDALCRDGRLMRPGGYETLQPV